MSEDLSRTRESYDELAATYTERIFAELAGKPLDRHLLNRFAEDVLHVGDMRALDLPDGALAGIVAFYSLIHIGEKEMVPTLRELRRVLAPGGLLLVAFHIGEETVHRDELWGHAVSLDFRFLQPARMAASLGEAGFHVLESVERESYPDVEYPSRRSYVLSRRL